MAQSRATKGISEVKLGTRVSFHKTVTEADIVLYAGIVGDFHRLHVDAEYARQGPYGRRIAHGGLLVGFMSTASALMADTLGDPVDYPKVSYGYDRIRFRRPVFPGDTVTTVDSVVEKDVEKKQVICEVVCTNQDNEVVAIATHLMRYLD